MPSKKELKSNSKQLELDFSPQVKLNHEVHQKCNAYIEQEKVVYVDFRQDTYRRILARTMK